VRRRAQATPVRFQRMRCQLLPRRFDFGPAMEVAPKAERRIETEDCQGRSERTSRIGSDRYALSRDAAYGWRATPAKPRGVPAFYLASSDAVKQNAPLGTARATPRANFENRPPVRRRRVEPSTIRGSPTILAGAVLRRRPSNPTTRPGRYSAAGPANEQPARFRSSVLSRPVAQPAPVPTNCHATRGIGRPSALP
jgi:hypothetical protein